MGVTAEQFLPTLARARDEGLPTPPGRFAELRLCALIVQVSVLRRRYWSEERLLTKRELRDYDHEEPEAMSGGGRVIYVAESKSAGHSQRCRIVHVTDRRERLREVYVPGQLNAVPELHAFEGALEELLAGKPFECLRCHDLRQTEVGTAYRGGRRKRQLEFHGHAFGDTISQAEQGLSKFLCYGRILEQEIAAYAWPVLWLKPEGAGDHRVLVVSREGHTVEFVGQKPVS